MDNYPDLESLRCFDAAASTLNFRAAAKSVHLSPGALGERIRRLEDVVSAQLFTRTTRRVRLTEAGRRLLPHARMLLDSARRCREVAADPAQTPPYQLTIGTRFELGMSWLLPALGPLRKAVPERKINLYFGDSDDLMERLRVEQIDAFVSSARITTSAVEYATLHEERYVFVGRRKLIVANPLARARDAEAHILIDIHPNLPLFRYFLDAVPPSQTWRFDDVEYMGTIGAVRERVLKSEGVAVLPAYFVKKDLAAGRLTRLFPRAKLTRDYFRLIWRAGATRVEALRALADHLRTIPLS